MNFTLKDEEVLEALARYLNEKYFKIAVNVASIKRTKGKKMFTLEVVVGDK